MNKSLKFLAIAPLLFLSFHLLAQIHYQATPFNNTQITAEITNDFGHLMDISPGQLNAHIVTLVDPNTYCQACPYASLEAEQTAPNTLQLTWAAVINADYYEIQYLNLANASVGTIMENGTSSTLNNLANGAYAFSIVAHSNGTTSGAKSSSLADIVILETPMLGGDFLYNCNCTEDSVQTLPIVSQTIAWSPELGKRYKFQLTFMDGTNTEIVLLAIESIYEEYPVDFTLQCQEFLYYSEGSNTYFKSGPSSEIIIHIYRIENYYFEFENPGNPLISATLIHCGAEDEHGTYKLAPTSNHSDNQLMIYPNPTEDGIWVKQSIDTNHPAILTIFDVMGKMVKQVSLHAAEQFINISELPAGRYELEVKSANTKTSQSFIKIN